MKYSKQQKQTKEFFEKFSEQWSINAKGSFEDFVNIVKIRNEYVERVCTKYLKKKSKTLDAGCGTGDLVISLLSKGYDTIGIDFAESMIEKAKSEAKKLNYSQEKFIHTSILEFRPQSKFDLISANGLIEYFSEDELGSFIQNCYEFLNKEGILVLESRNRLFNCFSFNNYTEAEIEIGEINHLLEESIIFTSSRDKNEILNKNYIPKITKNLFKHDNTGNKYADIKVDVRHQYTPFQMIEKLRKNNFSVLDLYPVHNHALNPGAKEKRPDIHTSLSYFLLEQEDIHMHIIPQTSSFMITVRKNE